MTRFFTLLLAVLACALTAAGTADACSCAWEGPFLEVFRKAPLVVRGTVLRRHPGDVPCMDVLVTEVLSGGLLDSGLRVQMGDGMHCRPAVEGFPVGSEWVLALDGPGAKPGDGHALSHCGEYWLRVEGDTVSGSVDGGQGDVKSMDWREFACRLRYPAFKETFSGRAEQGKEFRRSFGGHFTFVLSPTRKGWYLTVQELGRDEDLARLTPPLHFVPNPREIEGWQFLANPADCPDRPYSAEAGPANPRAFLFSPEVGRSIQGPDAKVSPTPEEVAEIRRFGHGTLRIDGHELVSDTDSCPSLAWMTFTVEVEGGCGPETGSATQ